MSRTIQHLPIEARLRNPRRVQEHHDHSTGECDLLPIEEWLKLAHPWRTQNCNWDLRASDYYMNSMCSCSMCHGYGRKEANRARRYAARQEIWEALHDMKDDASEREE